MSSRPDWSTKQGPGQPGLQNSVLKTKKENNQPHEIAAIEIEETMCHPNI